MDNQKIGERIKSRRSELDISAADLAARLSMSKATIHRYENGDIRNIKLPVVESLARELKVNPLWLLGKSERKEPFTDDGQSLASMLDELIEFVSESVCPTVRGRTITREQQQVILAGLRLTKNYIDSIR